MVIEFLEHELPSPQILLPLNVTVVLGPHRHGVHPAHSSKRSAVGHVVTERNFWSGEIRVLEEIKERSSVDIRRRRQTAEAGKGWVDVNTLHQGAGGPPFVFHCRSSHDKRRFQRPFEAGVLTEKSMLSQVPAMITPEQKPEFVRSPGDCAPNVCIGPYPRDTDC